MYAIENGDEITGRKAKSYSKRSVCIRNVDCLLLVARCFVIFGEH